MCRRIIMNNTAREWKSITRSRRRKLRKAKREKKGNVKWKLEKEGAGEQMNSTAKVYRVVDKFCSPR